MTTLDFSQIEGLAEAVGFTPSSAPTISAIAEAESGGNPNAECLNCVPGVREHSEGLTQINLDAHPDLAGVDLFDPLTNLEEAYTISAGGKNLTPWSTFTSGAYVQYLPKTPVTPTAPPSSNSSSGGAQAQTVGFSLPGALGDLNPANWAKDFGNVAFTGVFVAAGVALVGAGIWRAMTPARAAAARTTAAAAPIAEAMA